ncbi:hypothetical protein EDB81DRAFT_785245 [Dactylonectria macrodidyma]|uniref:C2H2-type domain-containing protein n=1 Tax=Dactylonectria macrodidyma TaxID=307937 RepID=A0A9P9JHG6_9HYPO|nr:hypothetical protein EDB81DRAFT_785245 [Dactylonectria macrodidyma]
MVDSDRSPELKGPTVAASANQCLESFQQCLFRASSVHPRELSMVEDQLARFSSWATSIGVFAPGSASMDHRLRFASEVQSVVTGLLESLNYRVQTCSNALATLAESSKIDASSVVNDRLGQSFLNIATEITGLNKISNTIRRASKETQVLKASDFQIKDDEDRDVEPLLISHFEHHTGDWFPGISETIRKRLAQAMLLRRKRILYRRHRQGNTSIRSENTISQASITLPDAQSGAVPSAQAKPNLDNDKSPAEKPVTTVAPSQVRSATTLAPEKFKMVSSSPSIVSASRTIASGKHQALIYPPAPGFAAKRRYEQLKSRRIAEFSETIGDGARTTADPKLQELLKSDLQAIGEITCPYCLYALPAAEVFDERKWQNHVKNDLDPYVCLFEDCDEPDVLYTHSDEWLGHLHQHAKIWRCSSHREMGPFSTLEEYMQHMREVHNTKLSDKQLRMVANRNSRKTGKLFTSCPLCGREESEVEGRLEDHLAGHLRSLALKSLPSYQDEVPDDAGSENNSIDGSRPRSRSTVKEMEEEEEHMIQSGAERFWELTEGISLNFLGDVHLQLDLNDNDARVASVFFDTMVFKESSGNLEDDPILQSMLQLQKGRIEVIDNGKDSGSDLPTDQEVASSSKAPVNEASGQGEVDKAAAQRLVNAEAADAEATDAEATATEQDVLVVNEGGNSIDEDGNAAWERASHGEKNDDQDKNNIAYDAEVSSREKNKDLEPETLVDPVKQARPVTEPHPTASVNIPGGLDSFNPSSGGSNSASQTHQPPGALLSTEEPGQSSNKKQKQSSGIYVNGQKAVDLDHGRRLVKEAIQSPTFFYTSGGSDSLNPSRRDTDSAGQIPPTPGASFDDQGSASAPLAWSYAGRPSDSQAHQHDLGSASVPMAFEARRSGHPPQNATAGDSIAAATPRRGWQDNLDLDDPFEADVEDEVSEAGRRPSTDKAARSSNKRIRQPSSIYVNGNKVQDSNRRRGPRLYAGHERTIIVDNPPTPRTPPWTYFAPNTAPNANPYDSNSTRLRPVRPVIVDERPRGDRRVEIEIVGNPLSRHPRPNSDIPRSTRSLNEESRHPRPSSDIPRSTRSVDEEGDYRRYMHREEERERRARQDRLRARIAEANAVINSRPTVPFSSTPEGPSANHRPLVEVTDRETALIDAVRQPNIDKENKEQKDRQLARKEREKQEAEEEAQRQRLMERMQPRHRNSVSPGSRRHRVLHGDSVYRWEE